MTYQTDEKHLTNLTEYFVVIDIILIFYEVSLTNNHLKYL